jgi:hypothetical protein
MKLSTLAVSAAAALANLSDGKTNQFVGVTALPEVLQPMVSPEVRCRALADGPEQLTACTVPHQQLCIRPAGPPCSEGPAPQDTDAGHGPLVHGVGPQPPLLLPLTQAALQQLQTTTNSAGPESKQKGSCKHTIEMYSCI